MATLTNRLSDIESTPTNTQALPLSLITQSQPLPCMASSHPFQPDVQSWPGKLKLECPVCLVTPKCLDHSQTGELNSNCRKKYTTCGVIGITFPESREGLG